MPVKNSAQFKKSVVLIIRDGWGYSKSRKGNLILKAKTPINDSLVKKYPNTLLKANGEAVGLPKGYQGNSEVGHMTIGAGRVIFQSLPRINKAIKDNSFFKNVAFNKAIDNCIKNNSFLHLISLIQEEGVHSHLSHLIALLDLCKKRKFKNVLIHAITDGRDAPPKNSEKYIKKLQRKIKSLGFGKIVTISGRYYAMDRDCRWERTKEYFDCIKNGICKFKYRNVLDGINFSYTQGATDEFIHPQKLDDYSGIKNKDSIIFVNFRTDRTRQLSQALIEKTFNHFNRSPFTGCFVAMTQYYNPMKALVAFKDNLPSKCLGEIISDNDIEQLRISETEKYAHVTFFFNGQLEKPFKKEQRILIPSPKVATYDLKPEMSALEIAEKTIEGIKKKKYGLIVVNLVNGDMVGHTGSYKAIERGLETVDKATGKIVDSALSNDYAILITADHGNAECKTGIYETSHTINPVPLILVSDKKVKLKKGGLADIAPTILKLMGIKIPKEMTGKSLITK